MSRVRVSDSATAGVRVVVESLAGASSSARAGSSGGGALVLFGLLAAVVLAVFLIGSGVLGALKGTPSSKATVPQPIEWTQPPATIPTPAALPSGSVAALPAGTASAASIGLRELIAAVLAAGVVAGGTATVAARRVVRREVAARPVAVLSRPVEPLRLIEGREVSS
jgi:hypothetical protein